MDNIAQQKSQLRQKHKIIRDNLTQKHKQEFDDFITKNLIFKLKAMNFDSILCYVSFRNEVSTNRILQTYLKSSCSIFVPKCTDDHGEMNFYKLNSLSQLKKGAFGIMEPIENLFQFDLSQSQNSICIIPALAYDDSGFRLGYGKGYYDKFLARFKGKKIILSYSLNHENAIPRNIFDQKADMIITEKQAIQTHSSIV